MEFGQKVLGQRLFGWLMKKTVYGLFVAGEDLPAIQPKMRHLRESGVRSILDYAVEQDLGKEQQVVMEVRQTIPGHLDPSQLARDSEFSSDPRFKPSKVKGSKPTRESTARTHFYVGEEHCEENVAHFKSCIDMASRANQPNLHKDAFAAIKLTGLGRVEFLVSLCNVVSVKMSTAVNPLTPALTVYN